MPKHPSDDWINLGFDTDDEDEKNKKPETSLPWFQLYSPKSIKDLAVNSTKVNEVLKWINDVYDGSTDQRICLLTGGSGCGKSATVTVISSEMDIHLIEYHEDKCGIQTDPEGIRDIRTAGIRSQIQEFESFILDTNRYFKCSGEKKCLLMIDEWTYSFFHNPQKYHEIFKKCLRIYPSCIPIVLILSPNSSQDSTSTIKYFPPNVLEELNVNWIKFNPIAPSFLRKAIEKIDSCRWMDSSQKDEVVASCAGDIRSLLNQLEVRCVNQVSIFRNHPLNGYGFKQKRQKVDKQSSSVISTNHQRNVCKDSFHYIGKILHTKRRFIENHNHNHLNGNNSGTQNADALKPPLFEDIDRLIECRVMSTSRLCLTLHQNYTQTSSDMNGITRAAELLSVADRMGRISDVTLDTKHIWQEYEAQIAVRGMMYNLSYTLVNSDGDPVKKKVVGARTGMFGPSQSEPSAADVAIDNQSYQHHPSSSCGAVSSSSAAASSKKLSVILQKKLQHYDYNRIQKELSVGCRILSESLLPSRFVPLELFLDIFPFISGIESKGDTRTRAIQKFNHQFNSDISGVTPENYSKELKTAYQDLVQKKESESRLIFKKRDAKGIFSEAQRSFIRGVEDDEDLDGYQIDWDDENT